MFEAYRTKYPELNSHFNVGEKAARDVSLANIQTAMTGVKFYLGFTDKRRLDILRIQDELVRATVASLDNRIKVHAEEGVAQTPQNVHTTNQGLQQILEKDAPAYNCLSSYGQHYTITTKARLKEGVGRIVQALTKKYLQISERENSTAPDDVIFDIYSRNDLGNIIRIVERTGIDVKQEDLEQLAYSAIRIHYRRALALADAILFLDDLVEREIPAIFEIGRMLDVKVDPIVKRLVYEVAERHATWIMEGTQAGEEFFRKYTAGSIQNLRRLGSMYGVNIDGIVKELVRKHINHLKDGQLGMINATDTPYYFHPPPEESEAAIARIRQLGKQHGLIGDAEEAAAAITRAMQSKRYMNLRDLEGFMFRLGFEGEE